MFRLNYKEYGFDLENYNHEIIEIVFGANERNLNSYLGGDYYMYPMTDFNSSVAYRPKSFDSRAQTNDSHFVFIEQNPTLNGYKRRAEVHSLVKISFRNTTEKLREFIPPFIESLDPQLYINAIFPTSLGEQFDINGAILILNDRGVIKYCVTKEQILDKNVSI